MRGEGSTFSAGGSRGRGRSYPGPGDRNTSCLELTPHSQSLYIKPTVGLTNIIITIIIIIYCILYCSNIHYTYTTAVC